jgi:hypothetical protein
MKHEEGRQPPSLLLSPAATQPTLLTPHLNPVSLICSPVPAPGVIFGRRWYFPWYIWVLVYTPTAYIRLLFNWLTCSQVGSLR